MLEAIPEKHGDGGLVKETDRAEPVQPSQLEEHEVRHANRHRSCPALLCQKQVVGSKGDQPKGDRNQVLRSH